jgi:hypothetical protein
MWSEADAWESLLRSEMLLTSSSGTSSLFARDDNQIVMVGVGQGLKVVDLDVQTEHGAKENNALGPGDRDPISQALSRRNLVLWIVAKFRGIVSAVIRCRRSECYNIGG